MLRSQSHRFGYWTPGCNHGYTKYCCFLSLWDSRYKGNQYERKVWPERTVHISGHQNIARPALVPMDKILLPPLHIKLGIVKNFVKRLNKDSESFAYVSFYFLRVAQCIVQQILDIQPFLENISDADQMARDSCQPVQISVRRICR